MRFVDAALHLVDERAFDMDADDPGHALFDRGIDGRERGGDLCGGIADQRGQESGRAEPRMRFADRRDRRDVDLVVEQHPAAAIDLRVDKSGKQPAPSRSTTRSAGVAAAGVTPVTVPSAVAISAAPTAPAGNATRPLWKRKIIASR